MSIVIDYVIKCDDVALDQVLLPIFVAKYDDMVGAL
jgi:hypothetical protein